MVLRELREFAGAELLSSQGSASRKFMLEKPKSRVWRSFRFLMEGPALSVGTIVCERYERAALGELEFDLQRPDHMEPRVSRPMYSVKFTSTTVGLHERR